MRDYDRYQRICGVIEDLTKLIITLNCELNSKSLERMKLLDYTVDPMLSQLKIQQENERKELSLKLLLEHEDNPKERYVPIHKVPFIDKNGKRYEPEQVVWVDIDTMGPQFMGYVTVNSYAKTHLIDDWVGVKLADDIDSTKIPTQDIGGAVTIVDGVWTQSTFQKKFGVRP